MNKEDPNYKAGREKLPRLAALDLFEELGAPVSEKTLDRYREKGILTDIRDGMWVSLYRDEIEAVAEAAKQASAERIPLDNRLEWIRERTESVRGQ